MAPIIPSADEKSVKIPHVEKTDIAQQSTIASSSVDKLPLGIKLTGGVKLRAEGLTGKGVRVAVIDDGVDAEHEGFEGKVAQQKWFRSGTPLTVNDHGTHVAGTVHLMAPEAEIYDYRVFGEEGGWSIDEAISTSIYEACFDKCDVINMSLGGRWPSQSIRTAVQYAHSQGVIIVCAAGNEGDGNPLTNERSFPGLWPECLNIAAVKKEDNLPVAEFSNTNPEVDYAGIGVDVVSFKPDGGTQKMSGTSMACPHVCGLVAALLTKKDDKGISYCDLIKDDRSLRRLLKKRFLIDVGAKGPDNATGLGFLSYLNKEEFDELW